MSDIQEKIRKLLNLANDAGASESEAETALNMASALAAKYSIDMAKLRVGDDPGVKLVHVILARQIRTGDFWWSRVALAVERIYAVKCYSSVRPSDTEFRCAGPDELVGAAKDTFNFIVDQVEALYKQNLPKGMTQKERAEYRRTFKWACSSRVLGRASEYIKSLETTGGNTGSTALVVVESRQQQLQDAVRYLAKEYDVHLVVKKTKGRQAGRGTSDGARAGNDVNFRRGLR